MSMWRNDIKYKYMFLFSLKKLACEGLRGIDEHKPLQQSYGGIVGQ